tara:strand:- start:2837 stop:3571 length:735 start_codon:yes stop_codon:yes gene_type:complete
MNKNYNILKVRDKCDSYYTPINNLFDLPMRLLINGKSQMSGKTTIILNLIINPNFPYHDKFKGENIWIISNNKLDNKLELMADKLDIPDENRMEYNEDYLEILYDQLEEEFMDETQNGGKPENRLLIFDDCGASGSLKNKQSGIISKLICNGRHLNLSQIFTSQRFSQVSTTLRTNITGAILFNTSMKELDLIADDMNFMSNNKDFIKMFRKATEEPRSFLVVNFTNGKDGLYMDSQFKPIEWS